MSSQNILKNVIEGCLGYEFKDTAKSKIISSEKSQLIEKLDLVSKQLNALIGVLRLIECDIDSDIILSFVQLFDEKQEIKSNPSNDPKS
jgi:hypothetical protein